MPDQVAYRVSRTGNINAYRITRTGLLRVVHVPEGSGPDGSGPVPAWLIPILRVRAMIYDPMANDLVFVTELPPEPPPGIAFTLGDGAYQVQCGELGIESGTWTTLPTKFSDPGIEDMVALAGSPLGAACLLIDRLIARIQPDDYILSGNAGGNAVSFPSLADMLAFYRGLKQDLREEEAALEGMNSGLMLKTKRRPVGGVLEEAGCGPFDQVWG